MRLFILVLAFLAQANLALAAERYGEISATLNGEPRVWHILGTQDGSNSGWSQMLSTMFDVSMWGSAREDDPLYVSEALLIDFSVIGSGADRTASEITIQYLENGYAGMYFSGEDGNSSVTIDDFRVENGNLFLRGSFSATAYYRENAMTLELDRSKSVSIEGTFQVEMPEE